MMRLRKLHSNPQIFEPITFHLGINLILGEKVNNSTIGNRKTNGVGKSMSIEFINFCLLKRGADSRVLKIPKEIVSEDTQIILDLEIRNQSVTIIRTIKEAENPRIIINDQSTTFKSIDEANKYFTNLLFETVDSAHPSFRQMMALMIREERSEFKDIIQIFDTTKKNIVADYTPHLYLFGLDLTTYNNTKLTIKELQEKKDFKKEINKQIIVKYSSIQEARSIYNELRSEVLKIGNAIAEFHGSEAFEAIQKDIVALEITLENLRAKQRAIRFELKKIETLPNPEKITEADIDIIYEQFKRGLGNVIAQSLEQVKQFKAKIDNFQQMLLSTRRQELLSELDTLTRTVRESEAVYTSKINAIDTKGQLRNIQAAMQIYNQKNTELAKLAYQIEAYDNSDGEIKELDTKRSNLISDLDKFVTDLKYKVQNFTETMLGIHKQIMDNEKASFLIKVINKSGIREVFNFEMRISSDGSHSVDREKVFIYDMSLLFDSNTRQKHLKFLIHDNIFDVDKDTLIQSLNYLSRIETLFGDFQYILTLNRDEIEKDEDDIKLNINAHKVAEFTKIKPFLIGTSGNPYQEK